MTSIEIIKEIAQLKDSSAVNRMGCSENWYNFYYAMSQTFSTEEISNMSDRELDLLERLGRNIQEGLY